MIPKQAMEKLRMLRVMESQAAEIKRLEAELVTKEAVIKVLIKENMELTHLAEARRLIMAEHNDEILSLRSQVRRWRSKSKRYKKRAGFYSDKLEKFAVVIKNRLAQLAEAGK